jgi:DNA repair exonuclease SbcCD nuclease subunit
MLTSIKFLAYSDIHHHEYTNGITGDDIYAVEVEALQLMRKHNVDFWLFGGDRFLSRNPLDITRARADAAFKEKNDEGIPGYLLVGNHDRWTKSPHSGHSMGHVYRYTTDLKNLHLMDNRDVYRFNIKGRNIAIHAVPAGHSMEEVPFKFDENDDINICFFHDIIKGCRYHNGAVALEGLSPKLVDDPRFMLVLGGDNHQFQQLPITKTNGYYIGAPCQHNWGDIGSKRGFLLVEIIGDSITVTHIESSAPQFIKTESKIKEIEELINWAVENRPTLINNIVKLTVTCPYELLHGLDLPKWESKLTQLSGARFVRVKFIFETKTVQHDEIKKKSDEEEWIDFTNFKASELDGLDLAIVQKLGLDLIRDIK